MAYRCEATTIEGFVQQLAVSYVANGYWFYVTGFVPDDKDPTAVDRKLMHYLRHGRFFVLLSTRGQHSFFEEERETFKDVRETPIKFASYAVSFRGGHAHVRVEKKTYEELKGHFVANALRSGDWLAREFARLPFEPWAPVRRQVGTIFRRVNERRKTAQFESIRRECLRLRRRIVKPFGSVRSVGQEKVAVDGQ